MRSREEHLQQVFAWRVVHDVKTGLLTPEESRRLQRLQAEGHSIESVCAVHAEIVKPRLRRRGMRWLIATAVLIFLAIAFNAYAQIPFLPIGPGEPVYDAANHLQNTISATEAVLHTIHWGFEQLALDGFALEVSALAEDLAAIEGFVQEAQLLGWEVSSLQGEIQRLFGLETAPMTSFEYRQRQTEIRLILFQGYSYAMRVQTLIQSLTRTVEHVGRILDQVGEALGNLSVSQTFGQSQAKLQQLAAESHLTQTAFERAQSLEGIAPQVLMQGLQNIHDAMMVDHPR
jgi:hypothetical protein